MGRPTRRRDGRTETLGLADLTPDPHNYRQHPDRNRALMREALADVGAARSIVIDEGNVILAGNGITAAAIESGLTKLRIVDAAGDEVVAVRRTGLTDAQKRSLAVYDNRTAELAAWDVELLKADDALGTIDLAAFWSADELARLLGRTEPRGGLTDPDNVPAERSTDIQRGDLFELGRHRLCCGDATDAASITQLLGQDRAAMVMADPPYNVAYTGGSGNARTRADSYRDTMTPGEYRTWLAAWLTLAHRFSDANAALHFWFAEPMMREVLAALDVADWDYRALIVWNKLDAHYGALGRQYKVRFEPCWYAHHRGQSPRWYGPTNEPSVWDQKQPTHNDLHPTMKPVELYERSLGNHTADGDLVLECFGGSGTTLIAAERLHRCARVTEILPVFCQVIIDRWEAFTGQTARKV